MFPLLLPLISAVPIVINDGLVTSILSDFYRAISYPFSGAAKTSIGTDYKD